MQSTSLGGTWFPGGDTQWKMIPHKSTSLRGTWFPGGETLWNMISHAEYITPWNMISWRRHWMENDFPQCGILFHIMSSVHWFPIRVCHSAEHDFPEATLNGTWFPIRVRHSAEHDFPEATLNGTWFSIRVRHSAEHDFPQAILYGTWFPIQSTTLRGTGFPTGDTLWNMIPHANYNTPRNMIFCRRHSMEHDSPCRVHHSVEQTFLQATLYDT